MREIGALLHKEGFSVRAPLLPGHGIGPEGLEKATWRDWVASARLEYTILRESCPRVAVAGVSMGGALAAILAEEYPVEAYIGYSPCVRMKEKSGAWAAKIAEFDGYVFVTGEYNHSVTPALANAISFLNAEWNDKAAGIVGYGSAMGARAVEHLRGILSEFQIAHVQKQGMFSLFTDFEEFSTFKPTEMQAASVEPMLEQTIAWTEALIPVREKALATVDA